jgi:hypothetical protein
MLLSLIGLALVAVIILSVLVHTEHGAWAAFVLLVTFAVYYAIAGKETIINAWYTVIGHPLDAVLIFIGYLVAGVLWSFFKYYSYVRGKKRVGYSKGDLAAQNSTGRAIAWMAYWPISMVAYLFGDSLYKLFQWIYDQVSGVYDKILNKVYGE